MKVVIKLDVSDAQANALAQLIAGKAIKRLASRKEITAYVQGAIDCLAPPVPAPTEVQIPTSQGGTMTLPANTRERARPSFEAHLKAGTATEREWPGYLRGWNAKPYRSA